MKIVTKILTVVITITLLCCFWGCESRQQYPLSGSNTNITKIELLYVSPYTVTDLKVIEKETAIVTIDPMQQDSFLNEFNEIDCMKPFLEPCTTLLGYIIRIFYEDGTFELISDSLGIYNNGRGREYKAYEFNAEKFYELIEKWKVEKTEDSSLGSTGDGSPVPSDESK